MWLCCCDCGSSVVVVSGNLRSGNTISCGCVSKELSIKRNTTHGRCGTRLYTEWLCMKHRCYNQKNKSFVYYGGRGITVCDEWKNDFQAFYDWAMQNGYTDNLTIDRKDVNGNYEPSNCRWITTQEQMNNKRNNHLLTYNGKIQTMKQWSNETGISYYVIRSRINTYGWSVERALTTPARKKSL